MLSWTFFCNSYCQNLVNNRCYSIFSVLYEMALIHQLMHAVCSALQRLMSYCCFYSLHRLLLYFHVCCFSRFRQRIGYWFNGWAKSYYHFNQHNICLKEFSGTFDINGLSQHPPLISRLKGAWLRRLPHSLDCLPGTAQYICAWNCSWVPFTWTTESCSTRHSHWQTYGAVSGASTSW